MSSARNIRSSRSKNAQNLQKRFTFLALKSFLRLSVLALDCIHEILDVIHYAEMTRCTIPVTNCFRSPNCPTNKIQLLARKTAEFLQFHIFSTVRANECYNRKIYINTKLHKNRRFYDHFNNIYTKLTYNFSCGWDFYAPFWQFSQNLINFT